MEGLSEHDREVVKTIFDPFQSEFNDITEKINENLVGEKCEIEGDLENDGWLVLVRKAIACAEADNFEQCFRLFNEALRSAPDSPSVLNDRAQALRLAGRDEEALKDLDLAIELSRGRGKAGIQALCQRGILYRSMSMTDEAKRDFELAANGGSDFAQAQLIALDPYAAMSNEVLLENVKKSGHS